VKRPEQFEDGDGDGDGDGKTVSRKFIGEASICPT